MTKTTSPESHWARLGAAVRLQEIQAEIAAIYAAFPDLRQGRAAASAAVAIVNPRPRRVSSRRGTKLSAAMRQRMSDGMKRFWAKRKAEAAKGAKPARAKA